MSTATNDAPARSWNPELREELWPDLRGRPDIGAIRAGWDRITAAVRELEPALGGVDLTRSGIAAGGPKAGPAFLELERQAILHQMLRVAQGDLRREPILRQQDPDAWPNPYFTRAGDGVPERVGVFFDTAAFPTVVGAPRWPTRESCPRPGPDEPVARLYWLATDPAAQAWCPTPLEQDQRFEEFRTHLTELYQAQRRGQRASVIRVP